MGYPCVRHYILFYIHGPVILHLLSSVNITKFKMAAKRKSKLIKSLADIAKHICQIRRRSDGNLLLKCANEHFFVAGHSN